MPLLAQLTGPDLACQAKNARVLTCADLPRPVGESGGRPGEAGTPERSKGAIRGAYLHIPFCFHKCHYCDFYSIVDNHERQGAFTDRLIAEIAACERRFEGPLESIFVGGGTPTLLATPLWERLLEALRRHLPIDARTEFTVEANPETVTAELAATLVAGGVNRISIGCQSFNPAHLKMLERWHDPANVKRSVEILRGAGIQNFNLDLIFAIPGQTLEEWLGDLDKALELRPDHLSCYGLTYEVNTPMTAKLRAGRFQKADEDLEAAMYEATLDRLSDGPGAAFEHYEISNWARPGRRCRHNMRYWRNENWWPFGPSASGHVSGVRWKNVPRLGEYLGRGPLPPVTDVEQVDDDTRIGERLMLGLRLREGIGLPDLDDMLASGESRLRRAHAIERHLQQGLLRRADGRLSLTRRGLLLADSVISDLL